MVECQLIEIDEIVDRTKVGARHGDQLAFIEPGMMWFLPWFWDHQDPDLEQYLPAMLRVTRVCRGQSCVSIYYLEKWATKRDPLCMMLPMSGLFFPDSKPAEHKGWVVTGTPPKISIDRPVIVNTTLRYEIKAGTIRMLGATNV